VKSVAVCDHTLQLPILASGMETRPTMQGLQLSKRATTRVAPTVMGGRKGKGRALPAMAGATSAGTARGLRGI